MKAEELRIGNWVNNMLNQQIQVEVMQIKYADDFKPIPLSNEWFEKLNWKNGFHKGLLMRVGSQINLFGQVIPISYVHELQNLYYALHKEEL